MKVLILSCNTGGGHNAAAKAVAEQLTENGDDAVFLDYLCLAGKNVSSIVGNAYIKIVQKFPGLFGIIYQIGMFVSKHMKKSPIYYINGKMAKYLDAYIKENPVDAIVMPHLYPAETITYMKNHGMKLPLTIAVMTDYTCIPFWEETDCDYYIVPHKELKDACVKRGLPEKKLLFCGIPVSTSFNKNISKAAARKKLNLSPEEKYILIAGGSMGAGNLLSLSEELLKVCTHERIIIVCGSNNKVTSKIKKSLGHNPRITIIGFTSHMYLYLYACDILFTKPGGLTSTEAAVAGIPLVHTKPIPGCETVNRRFFVSHGMSVSAPTQGAQIKKGLELLKSESKMKKMQHMQRINVNAHAADDICDVIQKQLHSNINGGI